LKHSKKKNFICEAHKILLGLLSSEKKNHHHHQTPNEMKAHYISTMKLKLGNWSDSEAPHSTQLISVSHIIKEEKAETAHWKKSKLLGIYIYIHTLTVKLKLWKLIRICDSPTIKIFLYVGSMQAKVTYYWHHNDDMSANVMVNNLYYLYVKGLNLRLLTWVCISSENKQQQQHTATYWI